MPGCHTKGFSWDQWKLEIAPQISPAQRNLTFSQVGGGSSQFLERQRWTQKLTKNQEWKLPGSGETAGLSFFFPPL